MYWAGKKTTWLFAVIAGFLWATHAGAEGAVGDCTNFDLSELVKSDAHPFAEGQKAFALSADTPTYSDENGTPGSEKLGLAEDIIVNSAGPKYILANRIGRTDAKFYVDRAMISCSAATLFSNQTGLERKAVIRTETAVKGEGKPVRAFPRPDLGGCDDNCRKLTRFSVYYIAAEADEAVLLSQETRLVGSGQLSPIVGWVSKNDIYEWPYAIGVRPAEILQSGDGKDFICGYLTLEDAQAKSEGACQPILAGQDWYKISSRMLVMRQLEDGILETVAPVAGGAGELHEDGKITLAVDPNDLRGADTQTILDFNRLDVFFLIDGTKSMKPYIDAIRGVEGKPGFIQQVLQGLQTELSSGVSIRAGFRVFRDTNTPTRNSIGEGLPLEDVDCPSLNREELDALLDDFQAKVGQIQVSTDDNDDYPEDWFGGIEQAIQDVAGCKDNQKLIFVITDAGYDLEEQLKRNAAIPDLDRTIKRLNGDALDRAQVFFVRPPVNPELVNKKEYKQAYDLLEAQAKEQFLPKLALVGEDVEPFWLQLQGKDYDGAGIVGKILEKVKATAEPKVIGEILIDINGGASLRDSINRLRDDHQDIPAYFWRLVERGACKDLGDACSNGTFQSVKTVYINDPRANLAFDVWMTDEQLDNWKQFLKIANSGDNMLHEKRQAIASGIELALRTVIREPAFTDVDETIGEYLRRAGQLPSDFISPLLGYSLGNILNPNKVSECELLRLQNWLIASEKMIHIAASGRDLPQYAVLSGSEASLCSELSEEGKKIPIIGGTPIAKPFENPDYTLKQKEAFQPTYWIPQDYLP